MSFGTLLKRHRLAAVLTQEELAEKAAISARTISDVERGLRTKVYRDTAARLAEALGLDGELRTEFEKAARGRLLNEQRNALPRPPTKLFGRAYEMKVLSEILGRPDVRLVTLTGPGGIGKSRIAVEVTADFDDDVWFVELGDLRDPREVLPTIARTVRAPVTVTPTALTISEWLGATRGLMVLDTFEHLVDAATDVADLVAACRGLRILVTSRMPLGVQGEHVLVVPPLSLPATCKLSEIMEAPASSLFVERARAARSDLLSEDTDAQMVAEVCRSLSGIPLAIELAAVRLRHMSLAELRHQLGHGLDVLVGGPRDLPRRQQAMRATIAWSYELLTAGERKLFVDLCVFHGGWTLEAAAAVAGGDVVQDLSGLVDKSLVLRDALSERYHILDVVRDFGLEQDPLSDARGRHFEYFLGLADQAEAAFGSASQSFWLQRLGDERANIRAALSHALGSGAGDDALRLTAAIWRFWMLDGSLSEGRAALGAALAADPEASSPYRPKALWGAAWLAYHQGDYTSVARVGEEMVRLAVASDPVALRNAWTVQGMVALAEERFDEAAEIFDRCVAVLAERGTDWLLATSLLNLGMALTHAMDHRASDVLAQSRRIYDALGDRNFAARTDVYAGYAAALRGEEDTAQDLLRTSLVEYRELNDVWGISEALEGLAVVAALWQRPELAATLGGAAEALRESEQRLPLPADRTLAEKASIAARKDGDESAWRRAWLVGRSMSLQEAAELGSAGDES